MTEGIHERQKPARELAKAPTGIKGLDEITLGGLPRTLINCLDSSSERVDTTGGSVLL